MLLVLTLSTARHSVAWKGRPQHGLAQHAVQTALVRHGQPGEPGRTLVAMFAGACTRQTLSALSRDQYLGSGLAASAGLRSFSAFSSALRRRDTGLCCFPGSADGSTPTSDFSFTSFASLGQACNFALTPTIRVQGALRHCRKFTSSSSKRQQPRAHAVLVPAFAA